MLLRVSLLAALVVLAAVVTCPAQSPSKLPPPGDINNSFSSTSRTGGEVSGTVQSATGQPVSGARVELRSAENGTIVVSTYTDEVGQFNIANLELGRYEIAAYSGVLEARDTLNVQPADLPIALRLPPAGDANSAQHSGPTVSVSHYLVNDKARKEFERAQKAFKDGNTKQAREHCEKALDIQPKYAEALTVLGIIDLNEQHLDAAVEKLQSAIDSDPGYSMAYIAMGATLNSQRQYQQALAALERGVAIDPTAWQAHFEIAKADLALANYNAALQSARRAAALNEKYPPIQLAQAHALLGLKRYDEAATLYERYLAVDPSGPDSQNAQKALSKARSFAATAEK